MSTPNVSSSLASANGSSSATNFTSAIKASEIWPVLGRASLTVVTTVGPLIGTALYYVGLYFGYAVMWLVHVLAAWPLSRIYNTAMFLLSPIFYTLSYALAPAVEFYHFLGQFKPLYTYLGSAAFIGVVTGLVIKVGASYFFVIMHISHEDEKNDREKAQFHSSTFRRLQSAAHQKPGYSSAYPAASDDRPRIAAKDTSKDDVWQWLEEYKPKKPTLVSDGKSPASPSPILRHKQSRRNLQSTSILEESSTE